MRTLGHTLAACGLALVLAAPASAGIIYDESADGDLSGIGGTPTSIVLQQGVNEIKGLTGKGTGTITDQDFFTITVPDNATLASIVVAGFTAAGGGNKAFIGVNPGTAITALNAASLQGFAHITAADIGLDIEPLLPLGIPSLSQVPSTPISVPLGPGQYTFVIQDTSPGITTYDLIFNVPEPASILLTLSGLGALGLARRRRA